MTLKFKKYKAGELIEVGKISKKGHNTCIYHKKAVPLQRQRYQDTRVKKSKGQFKIPE